MCICDKDKGVRCLYHKYLGFRVMPKDRPASECNCEFELCQVFNMPFNVHQDWCVLNAPKDRD
jgi:hypothetical protein